jgi:hypothetical protein
MRVLALLAALLLSACATIKPTTEQQAVSTLYQYVDVWHAGDMRALRELLHPSAPKTIARDHEPLFAHEGPRSLRVWDIETVRRAGYTSAMARFESTGYYDMAGLFRLDVVDTKRGQKIWRLHVSQTVVPEEQQAILAVEPEEWHPHLTEAGREYLRRQRIARSADYATTLFCVIRFGSGAEANPLAKAFLTTELGPVVGIIGLWWADEWLQRKLLEKAEGPPGETAQTFLIGFRWAVAGWNLAQCA